MDPFTYARAAASLGRNCLSTLQALYKLHAKYATVRKTVEAFHGEIAAIGISMQYINGILEQNFDLPMAKFYHNPHIEQTFSAAIAGCNLVLSCLDEEVEKIQAGLGPEDSKGRKGKARWLWKEETMNGLLQTLRGQHSAIFSIVQCLQVQNIAELGMKIEELRVIVSGNHQGVEYAVGRSPSVHRLQMETPGPLNVELESEYQNPRGTTDSAFEDIKLDPELVSDYQKPPSTTESAFEDTKSTTSSSERVAISYWRYHATMSNFAKESLSWHDDESTDDAASLRGLAPSTIRASHRSREEDNPSDRQSTISAVSDSSWTRKWLETQLSPEETAKTLRRMQSTISSQMSSCEAGNSIVASDMQTFLQYIRYFMPVLAEFDAEEQAVQNDKQPSENESYFGDCNIEEEDTQNGKQSQKADTAVEDNDIIAQGSSRPIEPTADEVTSHLAEMFDRAGEPMSPIPEAGSETTNETSWDIQSNIHGYSTPRTGLSLSREDNDPYCPGDREERTGPTTSGGEEGTPRNFVEESGAETRGMGGKAVSIPQTISGFSIYVEKRPHRRGTVICTADANNALRVSHSFSQALTAELQASGTYASVPNTTKGGHSDLSKQNQPLLFFVQKSTHRCVPLKESQDLGSESESEDFSATILAQGHMEGPLRIISAVPPGPKEKEIMSRRPSIESVPFDFG